MPVPPGLTAPVEVPRLPESVDTLSLGATYKATVVRLMQANGQLAEIKRLADQPETPEGDN